jgi:hypothetical protein
MRGRTRDRDHEVMRAVAGEEHRCGVVHVLAIGFYGDRFRIGAGEERDPDVQLVELDGHLADVEASQILGR